MLDDGNYLFNVFVLFLVGLQLRQDDILIIGATDG